VNLSAHDMFDNMLKWNCGVFEKWGRKKKKGLRVNEWKMSEGW
jgi:hypothetical protein